MPVVSEAKSITFTADNDAITRKVRMIGLTFQGASLTVGQRLRITDSHGSVISDYLVEAATDNADLWSGPPAYYDGITIEDGPAAGTWVVTAILG